MKALITIDCPCGAYHEWWHDCSIPLPMASMSVSKEDE